MVHLLRGEGVQLLEKAVPPKDTKVRPKKYQNNPIRFEEMPEWKSYSSWVDSVSAESVSRFLAAGEHGASLGDAVLVCNAAVYVWNYTRHFLETKEFAKLTMHYQPLFNLIRRTGHGTEISFLCDFANSLAMGYMKNHIPPSSRDAFNTPKAMSPVAMASPQLNIRKKSGKPSHMGVASKNRTGMYATWTYRRQMRPMMIIFDMDFQIKIIK